MKIEQEKELALGHFVTVAAQSCAGGPGRIDAAIGAQRAPGGIPGGAVFLDFFREGKLRMNKAKALVDRIETGLGVVLLAASMGCVGYVHGGYGGAVVVPGPPVYVFEGSYETRREVHEYSHRGYESHVVAHPVAHGSERKH
jgi:hypothetical protein